MGIKLIVLRFFYISVQKVLNLSPLLLYQDSLKVKKVMTILDLMETVESSQWEDSRSELRQRSRFITNENDSVT